MTPFDSTTESAAPRPDMTETAPMRPSKADIAKPLVDRRMEPNAENGILLTGSEGPRPNLQSPVIDSLRLQDVKHQLSAVRPKTHVQIVERWHGTVEKIDGDSFTARLVSSGGVAALPEEEGTFPLDLVSDDDADLVREGALFTYTIGRETRGGTRKSISVLAFRRMPMWHLRQVHDAAMRAEKKAALLTSRSGDSERSTVAAAGD